MEIYSKLWLRDGGTFSVWQEWQRQETTGATSTLKRLICLSG
jgi:hypothetical protein